MRLRQRPPAPPRTGNPKWGASCVIPDAEYAPQLCYYEAGAGVYLYCPGGSDGGWQSYPVEDAPLDAVQSPEALDGSDGGDDNADAGASESAEVLADGLPVSDGDDAASVETVDASRTETTGGDSVASDVPMNDASIADANAHE